MNGVKRMRSAYINLNKTTWQVNHEEGKKASSKSYIWIHRSGSCEGPPIILYEYTRTRSGEHAKKFLSGFEGFAFRMRSMAMKRWRELPDVFVTAT